jgi:hypothetical protein
VAKCGLVVGSDATMSVIVRGLGFDVVGGGDRSGELHSDDY